MVVIGHCNPHPWLRTLIYGVHMPAFFILSGYLYKPHSGWKTVKSLFLPVLFISIFNLLFVLYSFKDTWQLPDHFFQRVLAPFLYLSTPNGIILFVGFWYVVCLFACRLLMGDVSRRLLPIKYAMVIAVFCTMLMSAYDYYPQSWIESDFNRLLISRLYACFPFFFMGYLLKKYKRCMNMSFPYAIGLLLLYILGCFINDMFDIWAGKYGQNYLLCLIVGLLGFAILRYFTARITNLRLLSVCKIYSQGTLFILGIHIFIRDLLWRKGFFTGEGFLNALAVGVVVMLICYWPIKILLRKFPLLLGK